MIGIKIPWQVFACAGLVAIITGWGELRHYQGKQEIQKRWDDAVARGKPIVENLKANQGRVIIRTVVEYKDRIKVIREKGEIRTEYITKYIDGGTCMLPGSFRVFHDAAATDTIPRATGGTEAYSVSAGDLARTLNRNYSQYYQCREQVIGIQRAWENLRELYLEVCRQPNVDCTKGSL